VTKRRAAGMFYGAAIVLAAHRAIGQRATPEVRHTAEIAAIDLPEAVRHAVVTAFKGYQFVKTLRIDRGPGTPKQFEIHLERPDDRVTAVYAESGVLVSTQVKTRPGPALPSADVGGTWRGMSACLPKYAPCDNESILYRIVSVPTDSDGFNIAMARTDVSGKVVNGDLACTLDRRRVVLACIARPGLWEFWVTGDSLSGTLTLDGGLAARQVAARRQRPGG
jgi:hypothetical protein